MLLRAVVVSLGLMLLAIFNEVVREAVLLRLLSVTKAHIAGTVTRCALIAAVAWAFIPWIGPRSALDALLVGMLWVALTVALEFGIGHFDENKPWSEILADYNLLAGRVAAFVLLTLLVAPYLAALARDLL